MTETKNPGEKTLTVTPTKTLTLKRSVEQGVVRQSFSHGRTKAVVVEKVKRRTLGPGDGKPLEAAPTTAPAAVSTGRRGVGAPAAKAAPAGAPAAAPAGKPSGVVLRQLTEEERSARAHALADAKVREVEERRIAEEQARRRNERESVERAGCEERVRVDDGPEARSGQAFTRDDAHDACL